jgi:protein transport protein SEC23
MTEHHLPAELMPAHSTVEYVLPNAARPAPTFVFVVDACVDTETEIAHLKSVLLRTLDNLPDSTNVAFMTFGATVQLHDLSGHTEYPTAMVFRGNADVTAEHMKKHLKQPQKFVCAKADCEFALTALIEELEVDCWPVARGYRPLRCVGAALSAAASLLELVAPKISGAVLSFVSGACTEGPGQVVDCSREAIIRSHVDIRDSKAPYWEAATSFYDKLMRQMVALGHALHVVSACLDQVGLAEMKTCIQSSGGVLIASDTWKRQQLKSSIDLFLAKKEDGTLDMGFNATLDVSTSPTWKVAGVIGQCIGTGKRSASVADSEIGLGGTCQWTTCFVDKRTTFAVYFETAVAPPQQAQPGNSRYVQFVTRYQAHGTDRIRVTTLAHTAMPTTNFPQLGQTFDQSVAAVLLARIAIHKTETMALFDVLRWLDRQVIRLVSRFGDYIKDQPESLKLTQKLANFPLFMFHLRRSAYLHVFNNSPDETAVLRTLLMNADAANSIVMIHPTLHAFTMQAPPAAVPLDISSNTADTVLLLDTFFEVLIHHGETIKQWRQLGYEANAEYAHFKTFLEAPRADAVALTERRFPAPRLIEVGQGEPDARILYNRLNPSRTHNSNQGQQYGVAQGELVYTDDTSLQKFMDHLKMVAVQAQ